ncbi:glycine reductase [Synergistaceae bacterium OttesenSCG-928-D05]|nr:glycine reductase [Synergistaceae bacterium OttesenSCG-928-D05]
MDAREKTKQLIGEALKEIIEEARGGVKKIRVGLMAHGSELGSEELARGALLVQENDPAVQVVMIGPKIAGYETLEWIETAQDENAISETMERALAEKTIAGAVALHYPFPLGVTTIGKVQTPARGKACYIASSTGTSATGRVEAMLRNAIYGIAAAKANGIKEPNVGILNLDGAQTVLRSLEKLKEKGYPVNFGASIRKDGGAILRGNDLLAGAVDVCVTDTLTGNVLMKLFSSWNTGGDYEALGWGYGPSAGEGWDKVVSIISRASGAPVIANAVSYTAKSASGALPAVVKQELAAARKAGLDEIIAAFAAKTERTEEIKMPPAVPVEEEILGIDVLAIEDAVKALWKEGIYAESSMGCTGPMIKVTTRDHERSMEILKQQNYL